MDQASCAIPGKSWFCARGESPWFTDINLYHGVRFRPVHGQTRGYAESPEQTVDQNNGCGVM